MAAAERFVDGLAEDPEDLLALVNAEHEVLAYPDMARVLKVGDNSFQFKTLQELDEPSLKAIANATAANRRALRVISRSCWSA